VLFSAYGHGPELAHRACPDSRGESGEAGDGLELPDAVSHVVGGAPGRGAHLRIYLVRGGQQQPRGGRRSQACPSSGARAHGHRLRQRRGDQAGSLAQRPPSREF